MAAAMKIITRRAMEIINRIAHPMTPQFSNLDAKEWPLLACIEFIARTHAGGVRPHRIRRSVER